MKRISETGSVALWLRAGLFTLAFLLIILAPQTVHAESVKELPQTRITVNGTALALDPQNPAIEVNSRILVPMRIILEALGADIDWDDASQTVTASVPGYQVVLRIGNNRVTLNGVDSYLDVIPMLYNKRTYVPVRFVGEAVGASVNYDSNTGNVTILKGGVVTSMPSMPSNIGSMSISASFSNGGVIAARYQSVDVTGGQGMSPLVSWNAFKGAQAYVVAMADMSPEADGYLHWLVVVPGSVARITENASGNEAYPEDSQELISYEAPALEPEDNRHDYEIWVVALNSDEADLSAVHDLRDFITDVSPYAVAMGKVSGYINYGKVVTPAPANPGSLTVNSTALGSNGIPLKYTDSVTETAEGSGISIPLSWSRGPNGTVTYAFIFVDTTPGMDNYVHWLVADIPVSVTSIAENASLNDSLPESCEEIILYEAPLLDESDGRHTYELIVVALNDDLEGIEDLDVVYTLEEFEAAIKGHVMARGKAGGSFQIK